MTPERLKQCLKTMHWSQASLAEILGCSRPLVEAWARGQYVIPAEIEMWLEDTVASFMPPRGWQKDRRTVSKMKRLENEKV